MISLRTVLHLCLFVTCLSSSALSVVPEVFTTLSQGIDFNNAPILLDGTSLGQSLARERNTISFYQVPALKTCLLRDHEDLRTMLTILHTYINEQSKQLPESFVSSWKKLMNRSLFDALPTRRKDRESLVKAIEDVIIATADVAEAVNRSVYACMNLLRTLSDYIGLNETRAVRLFCSQEVSHSLQPTEQEVATTRNWKKICIVAGCTIAAAALMFAVFRYVQSRRKKKKAPEYTGFKAASTPKRHVPKKRRPYRAPPGSGPQGEEEWQKEIEQVPSEFRSFFYVENGVPVVHDADGLSQALQEHGVEGIIHNSAAMAHWLEAYVSRRDRSHFNSGDRSLASTIKELFIGARIQSRTGVDTHLFHDALQATCCQSSLEDDSAASLPEKPDFFEQLTQRFPVNAQGLADMMTYCQSTAFHDAIDAASLQRPQAGMGSQLATICAAQFVDTVARRTTDSTRSGARQMIVSVLDKNNKK